MAHEFETGLFVGAGAWHGRGIVVETPPSTGDALRLSGLDWTVAQERIMLEEGGPIRDYRALVRSSDGSVLGVMGAGYFPLQNVDAFRWADPLIASGDFDIESAMSLRGGKRIVLLLKARGIVGDVKPGDAVQEYLALYNSHDGSLAVGLLWTPVRIVCANTLRAAIGGERATKEGIIKLRHTKNLARAMELVRESVDVARRTFDVSLDLYRRMAGVRMDIRGLESYVREVWRVPTTIQAMADGMSIEDAEKASRMPRCWEDLQRLYESGRGSEYHRGTVWGGYNAVTEWTTHERGRTNESRVDAALFGEGARLGERALRAATVLVR